MGNALMLAVALALPVDPTAAAPASAADATPGADAIPVAIDEKLVNYTIVGDTASELYSQMDALGPVDQKEGKRFQGNTAWNIHWNYMVRSQPGGLCRIDQVAINLQVTMTLPDWKPKRHADSLVKSRWPMFLSALTNHEMGHRANGVRAAFAVRDALAGLAPGDCAQLANAANAAAKAALDARQNADADYDRETDHGARTGVSLR